MKLKFIIDKKYDMAMVKEMGLGQKSLNYTKEQYNISFKYLKYSQKQYQKSWNEINSAFSKYIENQTGYSWFYSEYFCVVSVIHPGISNWGYEPKIVRWWSENSYAQRRITAHELIISHYFEIYRHHYADNYLLTDGQVWALAEIAAFALTSLTTEVKQFWPWDSSSYYTDHNYPQIVLLQKKLKQPFLKRKSFDEYMKRGFELVKKLPNMKP